MVQTLCARILLNKTVIYMNRFHQSNFCYMNVLTNMNKILSYLNICFFRIQKIQYCLIRVKNFFTSYQWMWSLYWFQIKNKEALNKKWLHPLLKYTLVFLTIAIFIGYFFMLSRDSKLSASPMKLEIKCASNSSIFGKFSLHPKSHIIPTLQQIY